MMLVVVRVVNENVCGWIFGYNGFGAVGGRLVAVMEHGERVGTGQW